MKKFYKFLFAALIILTVPFALVACGEKEKNIDNNKKTNIYYIISVGNMENGSVTPDKTTALCGETITLTVSADEGYKLKDNSLKFNSTTIINNRFIMPESNVVIYARFEKIENEGENEGTTYSINYHVNEWTTNPNPTSYTGATTEIVLVTPVRKGYDFDGWYSDADCTVPVSVIEPGRVGNIDIYPKFNEIFMLFGNDDARDIMGLTEYGDTLSELVVPSNIDGFRIVEFCVQRPCNNVETLTIEDDVVRLCAYKTLYGSEKLETVNLPKSIDITNYNAGLFTNCEKLKTINLDSENPNLHLVDGALYKDETGRDFKVGEYSYTYLICYPNGLDRSTLSIPENVTHIANLGKAKFSKVIIPASVIGFCTTSQNDNPFSDCMQLNSIELSKDNKNFYLYNDMLIEDMSSSPQVTVKKAKLVHALNVGKSCFDLSEKIINGKISYNISEISSMAFNTCTGLKSIIFNGKQINLDIFETQPQLIVFSKSEIPVPSNWTQQDLYREILECENIYWYSETDNSSKYNCWNLVDGDVVIW